MIVFCSPQPKRFESEPVLFLAVAFNGSLDHRSDVERTVLFREGGMQFDEIDVIFDFMLVGPSGLFGPVDQVVEVERRGNEYFSLSLRFDYDV
mgnify:FL=1